MSTTPLRLPALTVSALLLALVACGGSADRPASAAASSGATATTLPDCDEVWVVGARLPHDYKGCAGPPDRATSVLSCADRTVHTYGDALWAATGEEVRQAPEGLQRDVPFRTAALDCEARSGD